MVAGLRGGLQVRPHLGPPSHGYSSPIGGLRRELQQAWTDEGVFASPGGGGGVAGRDASRQVGDMTFALCSSLQDDGKGSQYGSGPETQLTRKVRGCLGSELKVLPCAWSVPQAGGGEGGLRRLSILRTHVFCILGDWAD